MAGAVAARGAGEGQAEAAVAVAVAFAGVRVPLLGQVLSEYLASSEFGDISFTSLNHAARVVHGSNGLIATLLPPPTWRHFAGPDYFVVRRADFACVDDSTAAPPAFGLPPDPPFWMDGTRLTSAGPGPSGSSCVAFSGGTGSVLYDPAGRQNLTGPYSDFAPNMAGSVVRLMSGQVSACTRDGKLAISFYVVGKILSIVAVDISARLVEPATRSCMCCDLPTAPLLGGSCPVAAEDRSGDIRPDGAYRFFVVAYTGSSRQHVLLHVQVSPAGVLLQCKQGSRCQGECDLRCSGDCRLGRWRADLLSFREYSFGYDPISVFNVQPVSLLCVEGTRNLVYVGGDQALRCFEWDTGRILDLDASDCHEDFAVDVRRHAALLGSNSAVRRHVVRRVPLPARLFPPPACDPRCECRAPPAAPNSESGAKLAAPNSPAPAPTRAGAPAVARAAAPRRRPRGRRRRRARGPR